MAPVHPTSERPPPRSAPLPGADHLPDDPATLKQYIVEWLATLQQERRDRDAVPHRLDPLLRRLYGPRTESYRPDQPLLFPERADPAAPAPAAPPVEPPPPRPRRGRPHGRRRLPDHLRRTQQHYTLPAAERLCAGCGQVRREIGVDTNEPRE